MGGREDGVCGREGGWSVWEGGRAECVGGREGRVCGREDGMRCADQGVDT